MKNQYFFFLMHNHYKGIKLDEYQIGVSAKPLEGDGTESKG